MGKKKKRIQLHEVSLDHDIRYRGPLSYRHFRILGWICIALAQVNLLLGMAAHVSKPIAEKLSAIQTMLSLVASLSLPLLLLASFCVILGSDSGYKRQLITMGGAAAAVTILFELFTFRYIIGTAGHIMGSMEQARLMVEEIIAEGTEAHFLAFNIFVDVVLCILFMYFLNYRPVKRFPGKKIYIFRALAALPVLYEAVCFVFKILSVEEMIRIPTALFPLLPTKPPIMFLVFVVLAFYIKNRERRFCRHGRTHEEYQAFLKTNRNSWNFSVFTALCLVGAGILDFVIANIGVFIGLTQDISSEQIAAADQAQIDISIQWQLSKLYALGFGKSVILAPFAPLVLLLSYTRKYKNTLIDILIPIGGIILIVFVYLEAIYYGSGIVGLETLLQ